MSVTINDVAAAAGVSKSTVSKVLNNWSTISPATVQKVNDAIARLNYIPNSRAVSFARQSTHNIVYLTYVQKGEAYENPHMFEIMCGVHHELARNGYALTLVNISEESYPGEKVAQVISSGSSDGLIIHGSAITREIASLITSNHFPHIVIGHPGFESGLCWIDTNHALAGQYAANHMHNCGYSNVAFIGGKKNEYIAMERLRGFQTGMLDFGHHIGSALIGYTNSTIKEGADAAMHILTAAVRPQAIICENNTIAIGVVKAIEHLHLIIPDDIAVLTFDVYPYSSIIDPQLTIIDIDVYDMGVQAGAMMLRKLENPELLIQSYTTLPVLIQGASTVKKIER